MQYPSCWNPCSVSAQVWSAPPVWAALHAVARFASVIDAQHVCKALQPAPVPVPVPVPVLIDVVFPVLVPAQTGSAHPVAVMQAPMVAEQVAQVPAIMYFWEHAVIQAVAVASQGHAIWHVRKSEQAPPEKSPFA